MAIPPDTAVGPVRLAVADPERAQAFYERAIGLHPLEQRDSALRLGPEGGHPIVELVSEPDAPPRPGGTSGLFHQAILFPTRADLAQALHRVIDAGWRLTGASDHLVSEALYLNDPEGNGIELYRDRPRDEWRRDASGELEMATLPLDLQDLIEELDGAEVQAGGAPAGTRIGHVHLNVGDLDATEAFYNGALGFDVTVRGYPGALFLSAGGYHHHIGLNTWAGEGAPPPPPGARGLRWFDVELPSAAEVDAAADRLGQAGFEPVREEGAVVAPDPSGNRVRLAARS
jgi:catechol 2,3-dioxygenase